MAHDQTSRAPHHKVSGVIQRYQSPMVKLTGLSFCLVRREWTKPFGFEQHHGGEIRAYVDAVRAANASAGNPPPQEKIDAWVTRAFAEAARVDPIRSERFLDEPIQAVQAGSVDPYRVQIPAWNPALHPARSRPPAILAAARSAYRASALSSPAGISASPLRRKLR